LPRPRIPEGARGHPPPPHSRALGAPHRGGAGALCHLCRAAPHRERRLPPPRGPDPCRGPARGGSDGARARPQRPAGGYGARHHGCAGAARSAARRGRRRPRQQRQPRSAAAGSGSAPPKVPTIGTDVITYEYPLIERIRTLLRLEDLFERSRHFMALSDPLDHHVALLTLFEIMEVASRADLKSDLLQELERQK